MKILRLPVAVLVLVFAGSAEALLAQQPEPKQQEEFIPIDQLPPQDQLPAAPLLVTAYSFVALALFAYVVSVARRLGTVQRELERLEADVKRSGRT
jgi:CcmD family protein